MATLKEKLEALKKKQLESPKPKKEAWKHPTTDPQPEQCECGASLAGECEECLPISEEESSILNRLNTLGKKQGVNPPAEMPPEPEKPTTACLYCGGEFKHLSRHKCKQQPKGAPSPQEALDLARQVESGEIEVAPVDNTKQPAHEPEETDEAAENIQTAGQIEDDDDLGFFIALVDVLPLRSLDSDMTVFEDIIAPLAESVAESNQVPHWKMVDYGKGAGQLARLLEDYLKEYELVGFLLCTSWSAEFQACRSVINRYAKNVLMGTK